MTTLLITLLIGALVSVALPTILLIWISREISETERSIRKIHKKESP